MNGNINNKKLPIRYVTASDGSLIYILAIAAMLVFQLIIGIVAAAVPALATSDSANFIFMAFLQFAFFAPTFLYFKKYNKKPIFGLKLIKWYNIILSIIATMVCLLGFILVAEWFQVFLVEVIGYTPSAVVNFSTTFSIVLGVIVTVILAPVCEELVFRGALLSGLIQKHKAVVASILSGLAFAFMHMNPEQTVYQFFLGFSMAYLTIKSGSMLTAVVMHAANNLIAICLEFVPFSESDSLSLMTDGVGINIFITVLLAAGALAVIYFLGKLFAKTEKFKLEDKLNETVECGGNVVMMINPDEHGPLGKNTHRIIYYITLGICLFVWLLVFLLGAFW